MATKAFLAEVYKLYLVWIDHRAEIASSDTADAYLGCVLESTMHSCEQRSMKWCICYIYRQNLMWKSVYTEVIQHISGTCNYKTRLVILLQEAI